MHKAVQCAFRDSVAICRYKRCNKCNIAFIYYVNRAKFPLQKRVKNGTQNNVNRD
jgi:hypothetical protein